SEKGRHAGTVVASWVILLLVLPAGPLAVGAAMFAIGLAKKKPLLWGIGLALAAGGLLALLTVLGFVLFLTSAG
ncbi:MAG: hypothetical protein J7M21_06740, partial [Planctomycetes bacterium]|nr:hypothetical protein [Planctomycetota bacterium]